MNDAVLVAFIVSVAPTLAVILSHRRLAHQNEKHEKALVEVHDMANDRLTKSLAYGVDADKKLDIALATIAELRKELASKG